MQDRIATDKHHNIAQDTGKIEGCELDFLLFHECAQLVDHLASPPVVLHDVLKYLAYLFQVGRVGVEKALRRLGVTENGGERLVQLMGQRRREFSHRRDASDVGQLCTLPGRFEFSFFVVSDVGGGSENVVSHARVINDGPFKPSATIEFYH